MQEDGGTAANRLWGRSPDAGQRPCGMPAARLWGQRPLNMKRRNGADMQRATLKPKRRRSADMSRHLAFKVRFSGRSPLVVLGTVPDCQRAGPMHYNYLGPGQSTGRPDAAVGGDEEKIDCP